MLSWQQPESPNGIVQQYVVYYSFSGQPVMTTTAEAAFNKAMSRRGKLSGSWQVDISSLEMTFFTFGEDDKLSLGKMT